MSGILKACTGSCMYLKSKIISAYRWRIGSRTNSSSPNDFHKPLQIVFSLEDAGDHFRLVDVDRLSDGQPALSGRRPGRTCRAMGGGYPRDSRLLRLALGAGH